VTLNFLSTNLSHNLSASPTKADAAAESASQERSNMDKKDLLHTGTYIQKSLVFEYSRSNKDHFINPLVEPIDFFK